MKRSKLFLLPTAMVACTTPILFSCGTKNLDIEGLEDALFHPTEEPDDSKTLAQGIDEMIQNKDEIGLQKEIIYALYANCIFKTLFEKESWPTIDSLYNNNYLVVSANIRKCSLEMEDSGYKISFLGYINFVFFKDYEENETFKKGDFIQITYSINNYHCEITDNVLGGMTVKEYCFGFIQTNKWPAIKYIDSFSGHVEGTNKPDNWHNWTKRG